MVTARVYEFPNGMVLRCINGEGLGDDPDAPIPYTVTDEPVIAPATLEHRLARAEEMAEVWQETAQAFRDRCEAMLTDLHRLTGRSRAALLAQYVPEAVGGATEPL